ncbi:DUF4177 domain-containing protein [Anaeromyxobacter oryzae]|nr:DUF4177 domain-containing protein [Anaeromyxobacter oryzae]
MNRQSAFPEQPQRASGAHVQPPVVYVEPTWEYKHVARDLEKEAAPDEAELNALGADGWELAGVLAHGNAAHFYFKRQKE